MQTRFARTAAGVDEIKAARHNLNSAQRNLLLVVNDEKSIDYWLGKVSGLGVRDIWELVELGLLTAAVGEPLFQWKELTASRLRAKALEQEPLIANITAQIAKEPFASLYEALVEQAYLLYGEDRGYQFELEVQNCENDAVLRRIAKHFVLRAAKTGSGDFLKLFSERLSLNTKKISREPRCGEQ